MPEETEHDEKDLSSLLGETGPTKVNDDLPMRTLDRFVFYDFDSRRPAVVPPDYDFEDYSDVYGGSGIARTISIQDDSDLDSETTFDDIKVLVKLGPIQELCSRIPSVPEAKYASFFYLLFCGPSFRLSSVSVMMGLS